LGNGGGEFFDEFGALDGEVADGFAAGISESDAALEWGGGVVDVDDRPFRAGDGFEGAADQVLASLDEDLNGDVFGDAVFLDQAAAEVELGVGGGGEADFDLLEADAAQQVEELEFFLDRHRLWECLVAVAQVDGAPDRGVVDDGVRPGAVGQFDRREGTVFRDSGWVHGKMGMEEKRK